MTQSAPKTPMRSALALLRYTSRSERAIDNDIFGEFSSLTLCEQSHVN
jgi:hypothetical protein